MIGTAMDQHLSLQVLKRRLPFQFHALLDLVPQMSCHVGLKQHGRLPVRSEENILKLWRHAKSKIGDLVHLVNLVNETKIVSKEIMNDQKQ